MADNTKAAPLARYRLVTGQSIAVRSAIRSVPAADAEAVAMHAGAAAARHEGRAAAAGGVAGHARTAALRNLRGEAVGLNRSDRHGLRGTKAECCDKCSCSDQTLHGCSLLWVCTVYSPTAADFRIRSRRPCDAQKHGATKIF